MPEGTEAFNRKNRASSESWEDETSGVLQISLFSNTYVAVLAFSTYKWQETPSNVEMRHTSDRHIRTKTGLVLSSRGEGGFYWGKWDSFFHTGCTFVLHFTLQNFHANSVLKACLLLEPQCSKSSKAHKSTSAIYDDYFCLMELNKVFQQKRETNFMCKLFPRGFTFLLLRTHFKMNFAIFLVQHPQMVSVK